MANERKPPPESPLRALRRPDALKQQTPPAGAPPTLANPLTPSQPSGEPAALRPPWRRRGGGTLTRSEVTGVRLDPKLKYLAELAARKQRRTLSSFVEWAIEHSLGSVVLVDEGVRTVSLREQADLLWDVDEADRFAKLALTFPELLTYEEQILWKLVRENGYLWRGRYKSGKWTWEVELGSLVFDRLREHWTAFNAVARGEADASVLPPWVKEKAEPKPGPDDDLDIPF